MNFSSSFRSCGTFITEEVIGDCEPTVLFASDVIDFTSEECVLFVDAAILAELVRSNGDQATQIGGGMCPAHGASCRRARALARRMRCSS
jgi:hypothetical protein